MSDITGKRCMAPDDCSISHAKQRKLLVYGKMPVHVGNNCKGLYDT